MDPYSAPSLDGLAVAHRAVHGSLPESRGYQGRLVASVPADGFSTRDLEEVPVHEDLEWSLDPEPEPVVVAAPPQPARRRIGWLAPLVFLFGLFVAGVAALMAFVAAAVVVVVAALYMWMPTSVSDAEFILVPDTLPVQDEADAEFILVPDTLPVQDEADAEFILVPDTLPAKGRAPKSTPPKKNKARPARPEPEVQKAPSAPSAEGTARGGKAKVSLEAVPLQEAVRRVKGKAGRGEARSTRGH